MFCQTSVVIPQHRIIATSLNREKRITTNNYCTITYTINIATLVQQSPYLDLKIKLSRRVDLGRFAEMLFVCHLVVHKRGPATFKCNWGSWCYSGLLITSLHQTDTVSWAIQSFSYVSPLQRWHFLHKPRRLKSFFQFEIIINVLVI